MAILSGAGVWAKALRRRRPGQGGIGRIQGGPVLMISFAKLESEDGIGGL
jgi:hypothetical protein